ncbi:MAG: SDR family oxidoreductase [Armatimonadetes bacterium]|nr:SDR family oxidoreductase [Armatimonadota bacterium]
MLLDGKRAVVTGAAGALGSAVLRAFLDHGAQVVAVGHSEHALQEIVGTAGNEANRCHPVQADLTIADDVERLRGETLGFMGGVDALANIVGGFAYGPKLWEIEPDEWRRLMDLNLTTTFLSCRAFIPVMLEAGYGRVVNIASRGAFTVKAGTGSYAVSKAAVAKFTEVLREELRGTGVTAVAIAPGTIDTPANREGMPKSDPSKWVTPHALAEAIVWLCSEQGGIFSGGILPAYGDL